MDKIKKALEACEKVVDGIEDGTITTESALLQCSKIARLTNDEENLTEAVFSQPNRITCCSHFCTLRFRLLGVSLSIRRSTIF